MASGLTFGQLPDEEATFLAYLRKTGDVRARAVNDDPHIPKFEPLPVGEFLERFANQIVRFDMVDVYLGSRDDIFNPAVCSHEIIEGGTTVPFVQFGKVIDGVHTIVGGTKAMREFIDPTASLYIRYVRGQFRTEDQLAISNLSYHAGSFRDRQWVAKPEMFLSWAKKVLDWMRCHTPESVPVHTCNYETRATMGVAKASKQGLKVF